MSSRTETDGWKLGKQHQLETAKRKKAAREAVYNNNPKLCRGCNAQLTYLDAQKGKSFCNSRCSAKYNNNIRRQCIPTKHCKICNVVITQHGNEYCSSECSCKHRSDTALEKNIILLKEGKLKDHRRPMIKKVMIHLGVKDECNICQVKEWQGKPLPMILDHIDGDASNNHLNNLRLLCSNCDSQTEHYKSKNKGHGRKSRGMV